MHDTRFDRAIVGARRTLRTLAALLLLAAAPAAARHVDTFAIADDDARLLRHGELAIVAGPSPPPAGSLWMPVALPDSWRAPERWRQGLEGWYRFPLPAGRPADPMSVYLWRFSMNAAVWFNGEWIGDGGSFEEPVARHWNRPLMLALPGALWREAGDSRGNQLLVRLRVYPGFGHLMPPAIGPTDELRPDYERRLLVQITLSQVAAGVSLLTLITALLLWAVDRQDPARLPFIGLAAVWLTYSLNYFIVDLPMPAARWWALVHSAIDATPYFLVCFLHRLMGVRRPRVERVLGLMTLAAAAFYITADLPALARWNPAIHALMVWPALYLVIWLARDGWRRRSAEAAIYATTIALVFAGSVYDQLLNARLVPDLWRSATYIAHLTVPLLFLMFIGHLALRVAAGVQAVRAANRQLEGRISAAAAAMAVTSERERIYRDLHDHLGARLLSMVHSARDPAQAEQARGALAQMRQLIAASDARGGLLSELAAEWRVETELRCEDAGLAVDWRVDGDGLLSGRQRHALEAMMRELVSNVIRHAGATRLTVAWQATASAWQLEVCDDGGGIAPTCPEGHGMAAVRDRARELGGQAQWQAHAPSGSCCRVLLPRSAKA